MLHRCQRRRCLDCGLIFGGIPAPPAVALLVHLLDEFEEFAQIIGALRYVSGPYLVALAMMGLIHEDDDCGAVDQRRMIDKAAKDMCTEHSFQRPEALNERRQRRISIRDDPRGMSRIVKHVAKLGFEENAAAIGEIPRGLLRVSIAFKAEFSVAR
jgi:hypothetical protein